jgi:hypothetical protein
MSKIIANTEIKREQGKLYFCGTDANGNITINEAVMARGGGRGKGKKKKVKAKK